MSFLLERTDCSGSYVLDMSNSYQRAILIGIMREVAQNPHIAVKSLEMPPADGAKAGAFEAFSASREWTEKHDFTPEEWREMDEYMQVSKLLAMSPGKVAETVKVRGKLFPSYLSMTSFYFYFFFPIAPRHTIMRNTNALIVAAWRLS